MFISVAVSDEQASHALLLDGKVLLETVEHCFERPPVLLALPRLPLPRPPLLLGRLAPRLLLPLLDLDPLALLAFPSPPLALLIDRREVLFVRIRTVAPAASPRTGRGSLEALFPAVAVGAQIRARLVDEDDAVFPRAGGRTGLAAVVVRRYGLEDALGAGKVGLVDRVEGRGGGEGCRGGGTDERGFGRFFGVGGNVGRVVRGLVGREDWVRLPRLRRDTESARGLV